LSAEASNEKITQLYQKTLELDKLKSQFFANVSHELRTPLTLIMAPLERRQRNADLSEAERHENEVMLRNARQLYRHVTDLLDAAKLESGRMTLNWAQVDLAGLTRSMASHFESVAAEHHVTYEVVVPDSLHAEADSEKLQRVLINLLSNAFKFTPDGGAIRVRLTDRDGSAVLEVEDNGPGVPSDMRIAVFERFRQVEGDARRRYGGTGLGLAIVKDLVELHGGTVMLDEAPGGGALFSVRLPLIAPAGKVSGTAMPLDEVIDRQAVEELAIRGKTTDDLLAGNAPLVLVVEDNADMNDFIATTLRPHYRVITARDGREGLDKALAVCPDLILSDIMMPVMSGDEMVTTLRLQPGMENTPIIMLTAKADDELRLQLLKQGVQAYISKPFSTDELLAQAGTLLASRQRTLGELKRSENALKEAQQLAGVGNWAWDINTNQHTWSEEIYRIYGRDPTLPPAIYPEIQQYFTDESWARLSAAIEKGFAEGHTYKCDAEVVRPDGSHRWISARGVATRDSEGQIIEMHGTVQDITERKQIEDEIRELNTSLEQRVQDRTAALTTANRELDAFSYAVSHDLRAPLRAMSGFSQALNEDYGSQLQGDAKVYLEQIDLASHKMSDLIDGLLTLSRSTRGELNIQPIDISVLSKQILAELAQTEPARQVATQVEAGLEAIGDASMIAVVMQNLLSNAWKYTARTDMANIRVYSEKCEGERRYCVADNGAGFDMNHANRLFQPFQRLHRQEEFPGIGIGLATVQRIVHRHGGTIEAISEPGKGATFCYSLSGTKREVP
jgi:PAS domain S-box-containing protein